MPHEAEIEHGDNCAKLGQGAANTDTKSAKGSCTDSNILSYLLEISSLLKYFEGTYMR